MSKNKTWSPPGWPWELDLLALIFVVIALVVPYVYFGGAASDDVTRALREQQHVLWAIGIVVLFVMHLAVGGATLELISTPFLHLISPVVFALIAYYRSHTVFTQAQIESRIDGSPLQYIAVAAGSLILSLLVARFRKSRFLFRFRNVQWDIIQKAPYDNTYWNLITEFQPLVYPPRAYRACSEGILIEGWFYVMAVPFEMFQSLTAAAGLRHATNGRYLASTTRNMIRIELLDNSEPLYISPANRQEFLSYCASHFGRLRPLAGHSARGTHAGTQQSSQTAHGTAKGTFYGRRTEHGTRAP